MRKRTLPLSLLLLCLPLLGSTCDKDNNAQRIGEGPSIDVSASPIPEPSAGLLFGAGVLIVGGALMSRWKRG